jgi:predicted secreted hydrolase
MRLVAPVAVLVAITAIGQQPAWKQAAPNRPIVLPADHASHPEYKLEWWYYTGNVDSAAGARYGYQVTFFRIGVDQVPANPSRWAIRDLFMTHLAVTDVDGRRFAFTERVNRAGPGWAGAATDMYRVWNEDWQAGSDASRVHRVQAVQEGTHGFGVDLRLSEDAPPVLHGDRGYSRKGSEPGNASHYYSLSRMPTEGTLTIDGRAVAVTGRSWMDHEFGTSFLEPEQVGWDWFSIQLDDGHDLMIFQIRRADGSIDRQSSGTLVEPDRTSRPITFDSGFRLVPGRTWSSPATRARYPIAWSVHLPQSEIELEVTAAVDNQELHTEQSAGVSYWEGAIDVTGRVRGRAVTGRGYLEMTGYAGRSMGRVMR